MDRSLPQPAIVIAAWNRPRSLQRLLDGLSKGQYPANTTLHISIDQFQYDDVIQLAQAFPWPHGPKIVEEHPQRLGLRDHILYCGGLASKYGSILLLEDDLGISPFAYAYAQAALAFFEDDAKIAGVSLYNYAVAESCLQPFQPWIDEWDNWFLQLPSSWGAVYTAKQWQGFQDWLGAHFQELPTLPSYIEAWSAQSWKKLFAAYMIGTGKYFAYPRLSLTTNYEDFGATAKTRDLFQVPLLMGNRPWRFGQREASMAVYDAHFEPLADNLKRIAPRLANYDFAVDLLGQKGKAFLDRPYVLTRRKGGKALMGFAANAIPLEMNLIEGCTGGQIPLKMNLHKGGDEDQGQLEMEMLRDGDGDQGQLEMEMLRDGDGDQDQLEMEMLRDGDGDQGQLEMEMRKGSDGHQGQLEMEMLEDDGEDQIRLVTSGTALADLDPLDLEFSYYSGQARAAVFHLSDRRMPSISVIVAAQNGEAMGECLGSLLRQSYAGMEVVALVKKDAVPEAVMQACREGKLRLVEQEGSDFEGIRKAVAASSGLLVQIVTDAVTFKAGIMETVAKIFHQFPGLDWLSGIPVGDRSQLISKRMALYRWDRDRFAEANAIQVKRYLPACLQVFRRALWVAGDPKVRTLEAQFQAMAQVALPQVSELEIADGFSFPKPDIAAVWGTSKANITRKYYHRHVPIFWTSHRTLAKYRRLLRYDPVHATWYEFDY